MDDVGRGGIFCDSLASGGSVGRLLSAETGCFDDANPYFCCLYFPIHAGGFDFPTLCMGKGVSLSENKYDSQDCEGLSFFDPSS
jgi:hypothetical protein